MEIKIPNAFQWTHHARGKMRYYKLSEQRVRRVIHSPKRVEEGIAPKTVAMMQPNSVTSDKEQGARKQTWRQEIWVMVQNKRQGIGDKGRNVTVVISAWRYPGMTKPGAPLPGDILREIQDATDVAREENAATRVQMSKMLKKWRRGI